MMISDFSIKNRNYVILPADVGNIYSVSSGKVFIRVIVSKKMVSHKLGEFVKTRTYKKK